VVGDEGYDSLCPFFFGLGDNMDKNEFTKGWDGNWYHDLGIVGATGCRMPFSHSKELIERESSDYYPYSYIEDDDEPLSIDSASLADWDWE